MFKYKKLIFLSIILVVLATISLFVALIPKDDDFKLLSALSPSNKQNIEDRYLLTRAYSFDYEPYWYPKDKEGTSTQPEVAGESGMLVDADSGKIMFEKNSNQKMKIASLTKIMTAVVALEHINISQGIYVSANADSIGENTMNISEGEVYTVEELLYGLMLNSGNDAAYAIAEGVAGDVSTFVNWMNRKAKDIGMENTYFADPSGLDDSTYSTAVDLVKLTRYALKNPRFLEIVSTLEKDLNSETHKYLSLYNQTNLLSTYPGVKGVKTGYTEEAGLCLVTYAENSGRKLIGVVLKSIDRKGDMILMLDHGFSVLGVGITHSLL